MNENFINLGDMVGFISRPDACYSYCSTIISLDRAYAQFDAAKSSWELLTQSPFNPYAWHHM